MPELPPNKDIILIVCTYIFKLSLVSLAAAVAPVLSEIECQNWLFAKSGQLVFVLATVNRHVVDLVWSIVLKVVV